MRSQKPYLTGVWVLGVLVLIRVILSGLILYSPQDPLTAVYIENRIIFPPPKLVFIFLPIIEAFIYWVLRYKIQKKVWINIHVWTFFIATVILSVTFMVMINFKDISVDGFVFYFRLNTILVCFSWGLLVLGHIFFIATIVRNFIRKKEIETNNEPPGLLDEYIK